MTSVRSNNAPRRYFVDAVGRRVLIGLTPEETFEFERLDREPNESRTEAIWIERDSQPAPGERRWLELYAKHEDAWKVWMAQSRVDRPYL
ncbi:hypothetical protein XH89_30590 [Bradyrhizobium sp. CCBAU 53340]|uniref:hypothetical protein n=1 Tax=Bradyrhizobium sp. CCBAU 53340 TaxID=1325112 RepID=UPI00188BA87F|nr:hypothetical protein [Bradyrhizobium sp. CCBAU 53340]QOZ47351.1 hypothetical protein XH89_30590 [Bradyrhizobium sp. CCBAU 53340]